jgi:ABC-type multidrug transport system permease subunit
MRLLIASFRKEARRAFRDPFAMALWLGIPFSMLFMMNLAFGGRSSGGPRPQGVLLVADQDGTFLSGAVAGAFSQGPLGEMFKPQKATEQDGRARMAKGEASAMVILPDGFQAAILDNRPAVVRLVKNPSQRILPAIAGESLVMLSEAVHYIHLVAGDELRLITAGGEAPTNAQVAQTSIAINTAINQLKDYLDPPLLDLEIKTPPAKEPAPRVDLLTVLFPGIVFMSLLFMGRGASDDIWDELQFATLRRTQSAGLGLHFFLAGKLLSATALSLMVAILALGAGSALTSLTVANWPAAVSWMMAGGAAWYLVMLILQIAAGARNRGEILTSFVLFPSMMIGGSMFAFVMMPEFLARIGKATPLGWMVVRFDAILQGTATAGDVAAWLGIMSAACGALFAAAVPMLRWRFLKG